MDVNENPSIEESISLSQLDLERLRHQDSRLVPGFIQSKLEREAKKNWDLFYKRNETRFFRDRHWTKREFDELVNSEASKRRTLLEVGCGVGNLIIPLIEDGTDFFIYACDLSPRAVEMVKTHPLYDSGKMEVFQADLTEDNLPHLQGKIDVITLVFVLSSIHPDKFRKVLGNLQELLAPGGILLFRDYGLYDMAQIRFKPGHKISDNFYMRQDGTRSYFFSDNFVNELFNQAGLQTSACSYIHRRTMNKKEGIDVPRVFVQGKFFKPK